MHSGAFSVIVFNGINKDFNLQLYYCKNTTLFFRKQ